MPIAPLPKLTRDTRFQLTAQAFDDCADTLGHMIEGDGSPLSPAELAAAKRLLLRAQQTLGALAKLAGTAPAALDLDAAFEELQNLG